MKSNLSNASQDLTKVSSNRDQITAVYENGRTKITLKSVEADTSGLSAEIYYYDIWAEKSGERIKLFEGIITLDLAAVKSGDSTTQPSYKHPGYEKYWSFDFITSDESTEDVVAATGFSGTLTLGALSGNEIVITSTENDFDYRFNAGGQGVQGRLVSATQFKIILDPNLLSDEKIFIEIFKRD
jgi:hypothetical protein